MSTQQTTQSLLKEYQKRLREDIKSLKENFQEIIIAAKFEEKSQLGRTTAALYDKTQIQGISHFNCRAINLWLHRNFGLKIHIVVARQSRICLPLLY